MSFKIIDNMDNIFITKMSRDTLCMLALLFEECSEIWVKDEEKCDNLDSPIVMEYYYFNQFGSFKVINVNYFEVVDYVGIIVYDEIPEDELIEWNGDDENILRFHIEGNKYRVYKFKELGEYTSSIEKVDRDSIDLEGYSEFI